jgi:CRISPR-associated protein (TIGR03986 family)
MLEGTIKYSVPSQRKGEITADNRQKYQFSYEDFVDQRLPPFLRNQRVRFEPDGKHARNIVFMATNQAVVTTPQSTEGQLAAARVPLPQNVATEQQTRVQRATTGPAQSQRDSYRFLNPYNFVRYLGDRRANHVLGNATPPPHDRYVGLTGRITCEVRTVTPLFISDSHDTRRHGEHRTYRFFEVQADDGSYQPALPATSLRGMLRSVFEAATNSCFPVFDGGSFDRREGQLPPGLVPVRVVEIGEDGAKLERLDCSRNCPRDFVFHYNEHGNRLRIMNAAWTAAYKWRVLNTRTKETFDPSRSIIPPNIEDGDRVAALVAIQLVDKRRYQYFEVKEVVPIANHQSLHAIRGQTRKVFGYLHKTGPNIENKHDERLFFRWDDQNPDASHWESIPEHAQLEVDLESIEEYNHHLAQYWERHHREVEALDSKGRPWPITADDLPHPSYFIQAHNRLRKGDLAYYIPNSKLGVPVLRPILISRLPYQYNRLDFLPEPQRHCQNYEQLCPACRVFGWVHQNAEKLPRNIRTAYAGRVCISHGTLKRHNGTLDDPRQGIPLAILSTPKPTTTQFYLLDQNGHPNGDVTYNTNNARLRGRKFYRHHGATPSQYAPGQYEYERAGKIPDGQNRTVRGVLKEGALFECTVDFENLAPEELGALLWVLELEDDMCHRLGYGKPLGFGSISITVKQLELFDPQDRYASLLNTGWQPVLPAQQIGNDTEQQPKQPDWKQQYRDKMEEIYDESFEQLPNIQDLRKLLSTPDVEHIHYPRNGERPDEQGENFRWFMKHKGTTPLKLADSDDGLPL